MRLNISHVVSVAPALFMLNGILLYKGIPSFIPIYCSFLLLILLIFGKFKKSTLLFCSVAIFYVLQKSIQTGEIDTPLISAMMTVSVLWCLKNISLKHWVPDVWAYTLIFNSSLYFMGVGRTTYGSAELSEANTINQIGFKGYIYSGNELCIMLALITLHYFLKPQPEKKETILFYTLCISGLLVATKLSILTFSTLLVCDLIRRLNIKNIIAYLILLYLTLPTTKDLLNIVYTRLVYFYDQGGLSLLLFSGRLERYNSFLQSLNATDIILPAPNSIGAYNYENDFLNMFAALGILSLLFIVPYFWVRPNNTIWAYKKAYFIVFIIAAALFTGHAIGYIAPTLAYIVVMRSQQQGRTT